MAWDAGTSRVAEPLVVGDVRVTWGAAGLVGAETAAGVVWFDRDVFGSIRSTTATADLVAGGSYSAGGVVASPNAALAGPAAFGYRGELHVGSALHLRARQYVPRLGVFGEVDPIDAVDGEASLGNPYHYAGNDPVNHSDPSGMCRVRDGEYVYAANTDLCESAKALSGARDRGCAWDSGTTFFVWDPFNSVSFGKKSTCTVDVGGAGAYGEWDLCVGSGALASLERWSCLNGDDVANGARVIVTYLPMYDCYRLAVDPSVGAAAFCGLDVVPGLGKADEIAKGAGMLSHTMHLADDIAPYADDVASHTDDVGSFADDLAGTCLTGSSFAAHTEVLMANGTRKATSEVREGDYVYATDPETGESGAREVIATLPHTDQLLTLRLSSGEVVTTEDHKYWNATDHEWQESQQLDLGDELLTADGDVVTVEWLDWSTVHNAPAYDLDVADLNSFYVGAGDDEVLVHNQDACKGLWKVTREGASRVLSHNKWGTFYKSKSDGLWWAKDKAGHGGSTWKVFKEQGDGLHWYADADEFGDFMDKHKSAIGEFIPWKDLHG